MTAVPTTLTPEQQTKRQEERLNEFIQAAVLMNPDLKDRINAAAALQLMRLPDETLGWVEPGSPMNHDIKILSVITHLRIGAIPGMKHLYWLKNGFYPSAAFWNYRIRKDIESGIIEPVEGQSFEIMSVNEKEMFGISVEDRACRVTEMFKIKGQSVVWTGHGIIGKDELDWRDKYGKPRAGMQNLKNIMKTLKTRAVLDMYSRNWAVDGVTVSAEDILEGMDSDESLPSAPAQHNPAKIIEMQSAPSKPVNAEAMQAATEDALEAHLADLAATVVKLGGDPVEIIDGELDTPVALKLLELWIENNKPTPPEPEKPKRGRKPKAETQAKLDPAGEIPMTRPGADIIITKQAGLTVHEMDLTPKAETPVSRPPKWEDEPSTEISDTVTKAEIDEIVASEPEYVPADLFDSEDDTDPVYSGTEEQKAAIRKAAEAGGLPATNGIYHALAGAMKGHPMSKLPFKVIAVKQSLTPAELKESAPAVAEITPTTPAQKARLEAILAKIVKIGGKPIQILEGRMPKAILDSGDGSAVQDAAVKLEQWYTRLLRGEKHGE